jgi:sialate O-acetylesterase
LGTLYDQDVTFLNGKRIGSTGYQYPPRRYDIPEGLLQEGDNVIAIRFINKGGAVHFIPEKPYMLCFGDDRLSQNPMPKDVIPLSPSWKFHLGAEMPPCPGGDVSLQNIPTTLYNAVLYPLAPYAISGIVWYQGESNVGNPRPYERYLTMMINNWRTLWQQPELPFVVVQLANYDGRQQTGMPSPIVYQAEPANSNWAQLREAQRQVAKKMDYVELASAIDLGETVDIHPLRKREVAERIGLCFDRTVYNNKKVRLMPEVVSTRVDGTTITLTFDQPLRPNAALYEFEVAGSDGRFSNAEARAEGNTIVITSPTAQPARVRHAWKDNPQRLNAYTESGLPVGPFELKL